MNKNINRYVWWIEDEKYGLQVVCATKKIADKEILLDKNWVSGYGSSIIKRDIIDS